MRVDQAGLRAGTEGDRDRSEGTVIGGGDGSDRFARIIGRMLTVVPRVVRRSAAASRSPGNAGWSMPRRDRTEPLSRTCWRRSGTDWITTRPRHLRASTTRRQSSTSERRKKPCRLVPQPSHARRREHTRKVNHHDLSTDPYRTSCPGCLAWSRGYAGSATARIVGMKSYHVCTILRRLASLPPGYLDEVTCRRLREWQATETYRLDITRCMEYW